MLYFIPTPIGNLKDISTHSIEILQNCDVLICEDTRISKKLLNLLSSKFDLHFNIKMFFCLNSHNFSDFIQKFDISYFKNLNCAYLSDAGMPGISDPAYELIKFAQENDLNYEVLPGANAALLAAVSSGIIKKEFLFYGFLPNTLHNKKIELENLMRQNYPFILYESPKRILELIDLINQIDPDREIFFIKEATKKFEMKKKLLARDAKKFLEDKNLNGEWSVVVSKSSIIKKDYISVEDIKNLDILPKQKAKLISKITGGNIKEIYAKLLKT